MKLPKDELQVGDIVSKKRVNITNTKETTYILGEVIKIDTSSITVLAGYPDRKEERIWDRKALTIDTKFDKRDFSSMLVTRMTVMGYGNIHKGKLMKDIPSYYFVYLIQNEYDIPDNLKLYITDNWDKFYIE